MVDSPTFFPVSDSTTLHHTTDVTHGLGTFKSGRGVKTRSEGWFLVARYAQQGGGNCRLHSGLE